MKPRSATLVLGLVQAALISLLLNSCVYKPPVAPAGMAIVDATPDSKHRDRIDGIRIVSVNGTKVRRTQQKLKPGKTCLRLGFNWPQGGGQVVDLDFLARANLTYLIYYDVYPPYVNRFSQPGSFDHSARELARDGAGAGEGAILLVPPFVFLGLGSLADRTSREIAEHSRAADYVDVRVVARHSPEGIVCNRRIFPDGRIEKR